MGNGIFGYRWDFSQYVLLMGKMVYEQIELKLLTSAHHNYFQRGGLESNFLVQLENYF
jgi:hypothetical protein